MAETPPNIPVWGWFTDPGGAAGEYEEVKAISYSGKYPYVQRIMCKFLIVRVLISL